MATKKKSTSKPRKVTKTTTVTQKVEVKKGKEKNQGLAIVGLILNIILMPGLGSLIGGRIKTGLMQLGLLFGSLILGLALIFTLWLAPIGILLMIAGPLSAWIWGIVTGVQMINENS